MKLYWFNLPQREGTVYKVQSTTQIQNNNIHKTENSSTIPDNHLESTLGTYSLSGKGEGWGQLCVYFMYMACTAKAENLLYFRLLYILYSALRYLRNFWLSNCFWCILRYLIMMCHSKNYTFQTLIHCFWWILRYL